MQQNTDEWQLSWVPPIPTTTSSLPTNSQPASWPKPSSSQGRKALSPWADDSKTPTPTLEGVSPGATTSLPTRLSAATALGDAASASSATPLPTIVPSGSSLSPAAKQVLISAGSIGKFHIDSSKLYLLSQ